MARPLKEGMDYFPHDTDAVNDEKIEALRALHGNDGYAFYFILLERIYRTTNAELDVSKPAVLAALISKVGVSEEKFFEMLETAFDVKCFNREKYEKDRILTSNGIKRRASEVQSMRERWRKQKENKKEFHEENPAENQGENAEETGERKEKKRKENIIKDFNNTVKPKIELAYNTPELEKEFTNLPQNEQLSIVVEAFNKTFPDQFKKFKTGGAVTARREFEKAANTGVNLHDLLLTIIYGDWGTDVPPWDIVAVAREPTNMALVNASIDRQEQRGGIECVGCAP